MSLMSTVHFCRPPGSDHMEANPLLKGGEVAEEKGEGTTLTSL